jgi:dTDP-glucose pyrophosphorylase
MNILIPMAGLGSRFPNHSDPKPLIDVFGKPMIQAAIDSMAVKGNLIFIVRSQHIEQYNVDKKLKELYDCQVISVDHITEGPACTALLAEDLINNEEPLIIANCDQIMRWDSETFKSYCENYPHDAFRVTYFSDTNKNSYAKLNKFGFVTEVKEKEVISNISLNGIHFWKRGSDFVSSAKEMISMNDRAPNNEFYIGPTYNYMVKKNLKVGIYHIPNEQHWAIGTEEDLNKYLRQNIVENDLLKEIRTFTEDDDKDWDLSVFSKKIPGIIPFPKSQNKIEFSDWNRSQLTQYLKKISSHAKAILEIGVCRNGKSSTWCFLDNKNKDTFYFGIDLDDKSFLDSEEENIYTLKTSSSNINEIMSFVKSKGIEKFDFIFIDGWHSVNQVLDDWKFAEFLADGGIVGFHDTNHHPGPMLFIDNLNPDKYIIEKKCTTFITDYGISFVSKK